MRNLRGAPIDSRGSLVCSTVRVPNSNGTELVGEDMVNIALHGSRPPRRTATIGEGTGTPATPNYGASGALTQVQGGGAPSGVTPSLGNDFPFPPADCDPGQTAVPAAVPPRASVGGRGLGLGDESAVLALPPPGMRLVAGARVKRTAQDAQPLSSREVRRGGGARIKRTARGPEPGYTRITDNLTTASVAEAKPEALAGAESTPARGSRVGSLHPPAASGESAKGASVGVDAAPHVQDDLIIVIDDDCDKNCHRFS